MFSIYKITNAVNGRTYVGMTSKTIAHRFGRHLRALRDGNHITRDLMKDWKNGLCSLSVEQIGAAENKGAALALEFVLINRESNPYNIARGNEGDMIGFLKTMSPGRRAHIYAEILAIGSSESQYVISKRFEISRPLVSMILNGHRTAIAPDTSFAAVRTDVSTIVCAPRPKASAMKQMYASWSV